MKQRSRVDEKERDDSFERSERIESQVHERSGGVVGRKRVSASCVGEGGGKAEKCLGGYCNRVVRLTRAVVLIANSGYHNVKSTGETVG